MRVAIVRLTAMGDVIHTLASMQFIKARIPGIHITWFVEEKFAEILRHNPHIDTIVPVDMHGLKKAPSLSALRAIVHTVKAAGPFDRVIDVQGLIKSAVLARIAGSDVAGLDAASAKEGIATLLYRYTYPVDCAEIAPMRFASLLAQSLGIEITKEMLSNKAPYLYFETDEACRTLDPFFTHDKKNVLVVTGASNASKTYPPEKFTELAELLKEYNLLLVAGSEAERESARAIAENSPATLLPPMSLNTLKYAVAKSDLLIGGDTGPSHMAWAMNRPSILLFGSTPKSMMMETPVNIAITSGAKVHPCRFDKNDRSIATILPKRIAEAVREVLS
ncbi:lipopolysaccharide heptosyltransferase I [Hydrogenimonas cancrithermarum]|uniref:Lipopolysaccharide heptosyltransferase 1 n=1 Tax=Hydrogenimonas cancrithermarum TaxID=2993563 RepID=A0ABM8FNS8_9BACT|nr:lipopolysaccharide heptosyltransferase I [Hydrogenimonas cancrithermarum]BDY13448.1 lipopolysaccharide heptosyltransferase I [Hydrogenimonas cancrithermarum]